MRVQFGNVFIVDRDFIQGYTDAWKAAINPEDKDRLRDRIVTIMGDDAFKDNTMTPISLLNSSRTRIGGQISPDEFVIVTNTFRNEKSNPAIVDLANTYEDTYHTEVPTTEEIMSDKALVVDGQPVRKLVPNKGQVDFQTEMLMLEIVGVPIKKIESPFQVAGTRTNQTQEE